MGIYGHNSVNIAQLKDWVSHLDKELIIERSKQGIYGRYASETICRDLLDGFVRCVESLADDCCWYHEVMDILNPVLRNALFIVADNAIQVANFYEILIVPSDVQTKKKIIKGFDYIDIGCINVVHEGHNIATIGQKSDLIWACFYELFIKEDLYRTEHTLPNHEEIMSLQLLDVYGLNENEIHDIINNVLFRCSTELGLNFKVYHIDSLITEDGISGNYELHQNMTHYDGVPVMYFNNAFSQDDVRMQYLSYYHVIEYYFVRAQNNSFVDAIQAAGCLSVPLKHNELHKLLKRYTSSTKELDSLKLVLTKAIDVQNIKDWLALDSDRIRYFANNATPGIVLNVALSETDFIARLANRIYHFRCAIVHAKGDVDAYMAMPEISHNEIEKEILLITIVAENVIKQCSNW